MHYVILGASAAGANAAKTIRSIDSKGEITIISSDTAIYSRCMLHFYISNHKNLERLSFVLPEFIEKNRLNWIKGASVTSLDTSLKEVKLSNGKLISYDKLLIATGASSFIPPIPNLRTAENVFGLRNLEDAEIIKTKVQSGIKNVVILGAGLVGVDALTGLLDYPVKVSIVEMADRIMPLQLDKQASSLYETKFREKGANILINSMVSKIITDSDNCVKSIEFAKGEKIPCDMVIVATGVCPNTCFIKPDTIQVNRGIVINTKGETNIPDVYAAGDVTNIAPIWPAAVKQGITAGSNMAGREAKLDDNFAMRNSINFMGVPTVSIGLVNPECNSYEVETLKDNHNYKKIIHKDGIIYGAIFQGDVSYTGTYLELIKNKINIKTCTKNIFEIDYADFFSTKEDGQFAFTR